MGIALLKKLNTKLPDSIKIAFGPIIRNKLIKNSVFLSQYKELDSLEKMSQIEIEEKQINKVKQVLVHAYEHTSYYRKLFDEIGFDVYSFSEKDDIKKIPLLTKEIIIEHFDDIQADDISDFYSATTGGSTGTPLKIYLEKDSIYKEKAFIYHFWNKLGYDYKTSRIASFRGTDFK